MLEQRVTSPRVKHGQPTTLGICCDAEYRIQCRWPEGVRVTNRWLSEIHVGRSLDSSKSSKTSKSQRSLDSSRANRWTSGSALRNQSLMRQIYHNYPPSSLCSQFIDSVCVSKCIEQQEEGGSRYSHNKVTQSPKQRQSDMFPSQHVLNMNTHNIHTLEFSNILP